MTVSVELAEVQRIGFPVGGEPLVALDLADTLMTAVEPAVDLLGPAEQSAAWWALQANRLPASPVPDPAAVRRLRAAVRELLDAQVEGRVPDAMAIEDVNAAAAAVPRSPRLDVVDGVARAQTRWHTEHGGNAALAYIAGEVISLFETPDRLAKLRRCANPACSMLFLAETARRQWCADNVCGNRMRVARHQQKVRAAKRAD